MPRMQIEIRTSDGVCPAFTFHPNGLGPRPNGAGPWPGVLLYMDGVGMRPAMHAIASRIAAGGYYVLLPDLFYRAGSYTAPDPTKLMADEAVRNDWFKRMMAAASAERIMRDTPAFLDHLEAHARGPRFGATGYCMGGRMAFTAAGHFPERIAAAAAFHPGGFVTDAPDSPHLLATKIKARILVAGAIEDRNFTDEQKHKLEEALRAAGVDHTVETWPARHGWVPTDMPVHDAAQAERHFTTLQEFFAL
jgi:carboxymethylenebutenolidase